MFINEVLSHVLPILAVRFERPGDDNLAYHNSPHTVSVVEVGQQIAEAMYLTVRQKELIAIGCAFHDISQIWEERHRADGAIIRQRAIGKNEETSAFEAVVWMQWRGGYATEEQKLVTTAVLATVPDWDSELGTVVQDIDQFTHPVVRAVAYADLAVCGMDPEAFSRDSRNLFIENELDITRTMRSGEWTNLSFSQLNWYQDRYASWMDSQVQFVQGRQIRFEKDIEGLPLAVQRNLRHLFCKFPEVIEAAKLSARLARINGFSELQSLY